MALKEYVGAIVLEVDGQEYEVIDLNVDHQSGKKLVKTMNRTGRALGFRLGLRHCWPPAPRVPTAAS